MRVRRVLVVLAVVCLAMAVPVGSQPSGAADPPPTVSIAPAVGTDSLGVKDAKIRFAVTLSEPSTVPVSVQWSAHADGTPDGAIPGADFVAKAGTLTFKPASRTGLTPTTKYVTVKLVADTDPLEGDETFAVTLSSPTAGYDLGTASATGTISELNATPTFTIHPASVVEGDTGTKNGAKAFVRLGQPQPTTTTVSVAVTGGDATAGDDYKAIKPKTLTFKPGKTSKAVTVAAFPDLTVEGDETVELTLSDPTGGPTIATPTATVSILDDDDDETPPTGDLTVDTAADTHDAAPGDGLCDDGTGACSLRAAVDEINARLGTDPTTIALTADPVLTVAGPNDDQNLSGDIDILKPDITIDGNNHTIDANGIDRALHAVGAGTDLTIVDTTITGGDAPPTTQTFSRQVRGGGVHVGGTLALVGTTLTGNRSHAEPCSGCSPTQWSGEGGGAYASAATVLDSSITGNVAAVSGGGLHVAGSIDVQGSTISGNEVTTPSTCACAQDGGGLYAQGAATIVDSSITGNVASGSGGGIRTTLDPLELRRSLVSGNTAGSFGGGVYGVSGFELVLADSTFSGNSALYGTAVALVQAFTSTGPVIENSTFVGTTGGPMIAFWAPTCSPPAPVCPPPPGNLTITRSVIAPAATGTACALGALGEPSVQSVTDGGFNLISNGGACAFGDPADPRLGPLADNGGPTLTHLPLAGSPAIDGGGACTGTDQRGVLRPQGTACDIGAVEVAP